jgi:hypothetical protein
MVEKLIFNIRRRGMKKQVAVALALACLVLGGVYAYTLIGTSRDGLPYDSRVSYYVVDGNDLYIDRLYIATPLSGVDDMSGLIDAYYPGGAPILKSMSELRDEGKYYKKISLLFTGLGNYPGFDPNINPSKVLHERIRSAKATKIVGEQYGLTYQTQPDDVKNDLDEIWIERDDGLRTSFISCRKKISARNVPQCTHIYYDEDFFYRIRYDKRLLPEWQTIRDNVVAMFESFRSKETSQAFLKQQIPIAYQEQIQQIGDAHADRSDRP